MNRTFLIGAALGAVASTLAFVAARILNNSSEEKHYELSYYSQRSPMPDEFSYRLIAGNPGINFNSHDYSYLINMISKCRIHSYVVDVRLLPDGGRLSFARFTLPAKSVQIGCLSKYVDDHGFVGLQVLAFQ